MSSPSRNPFRSTALVLDLGLIALLLVFHVYGYPILPNTRTEMVPAKIRPHERRPGFAWVYNFRASKADEPSSFQSRVKLYEGTQEQVSHIFVVEEVHIVGGGRWVHNPGQIVFSTSDNTDPRTNGRIYSLEYPMLYTRAWGYVGLAVFFGCVIVLWIQKRSAVPAQPATTPASTRWKWHLIAACVVFAAASYFNTGTLSPYGNSSLIYVDKAHGYLYNIDHSYWRQVYDFVNGADRASWDGAQLIRRVLFYVLAWPFTKVGGFEYGGFVAGVVLNLAGIVASVLFLRRRYGDRGAVFATWLLALTPAATYWIGMPYAYSFIFPGSLTLMMLLMSLPSSTGRRLVGLSAAMGVCYLGYDLIAFFVPATLAALFLRRKFVAALISAAIQVIPTAIWLWALTHIFHQNLETGNTAAYGNIVRAYLAFPPIGAWWQSVSGFVDIGADVFFGAHFLFLPAFFLLVLLLNPLTVRARFSPEELGLFAAGLALFLFTNLAPQFGGWQLRGTWIARLFQPLYPALIFFIARWWQESPPLSPALRRPVVVGLGVFVLGNAAIMFGPISNDPGHISSAAIYRFYDHSPVRTVYEHSLQEFGRRPYGFPRPPQ
jgi:hypothetical protein